MRVLLFLAVLSAATAALGADPHVLTVPVPNPRAEELGSPPALQPGLAPSTPEGDQRGTEQSPIIVRVVPSQKTTDEIEAERKVREESAAAEQGLTIYTRYLWLATVSLAFVALVQAALFIWQLILLNRSVKDARTAADAANASAEAAKLNANAAQRMLVLAQRPKLRVRNVVVRNPDPRHRQPFRLFEPGELVSGQIYVVNIGGTVARIDEGDCRVYWTNQGLPMERPYEGQEIENMIPPIKLEAGQSTPIRFASRKAMGSEGDDIKAFAAGWRLYVMGWIAYTDDLNNPRRTAFCREYRQIPHSAEGRFFPIDDPDYEHEE